MVSNQWIKLLVVFFSFLSLSFGQGKTNSEALLEVGNFANRIDKQYIQRGIKIVSYNIRWRGGDDLKKLIELFKTDKEIGNASIIGLQEVDRKKKRTRNENTIRKMAQSLNMSYVWAAPPNPKGKERNEEETGVAILSALPLSDITRIILPNEGPDGRRRVAIGATVEIGELKIRVYSVHAETRLKSDEKLEQIQEPISDLDKNYKEIDGAIILGDFNTIFPEEVENTNRLFLKNKFNTPFSEKQTTWTQFFIELKLDWIWLRGFQPTEFGINKQISLSDHFPLWVMVDFFQPQAQITSLPKPQNENLRKELLKMAKEDQDVRKNFEGENINNVKLIEKMNSVDLKTTKRLKEIVAKYGWLTAELVGKDGAEAALLILQHSPDWDFQKEMLPFVEASAKRGEIHAHNYTLLVDRVRVHFGQKQLYGTQLSIKDGKLILDPIEDEEHVDDRRKALGLSPLEEYLKIIEELYKLPVERKPKTNR